MKSIWSNSCKLAPFPPLNGNIEVDTAVIGAGLAGILTAYALKERGHKTVVLEAKSVADGQTKNTTAKITCQHGLIYNKMIENHGVKTAKKYAEANLKAIEQYDKLIKKLNIECNFQRTSAVLYSAISEEVILKEYGAALKLGIPSKFSKESELPFKIAGALEFYNQAQFNPLKFIDALSKKLEIYENTPAISVKGSVIQTPGGCVTAKNIVFATHYPFINVPGFYFTRLHQSRSYAVAAHTDLNLKNMYYPVDKSGLSIRSYKDITIFGGGAHRTGENYAGNKYEGIISKINTICPKSEIVCKWSAQDCMPASGIPIIGRYSLLHPNWYVITGFQKWGMTSAMVASELIVDAIDQKDNPFSKVFSPTNFSASDTLPMAKHAAKSVKGLSKGFLIKSSAPRCPHMGCRLEWNPDEESWDCPCHGSRFDKHGKLIDNPAQNNLKKP